MHMSQEMHFVASKRKMHKFIMLSIIGLSELCKLSFIFDKLIREMM